MRSRKILRLTAGDVQKVAETWLAEALPLKDHGWKCTSHVLWEIVLLAAAWSTSVSSVCSRRLVRAPSDEGFRKALRASLPRGIRSLEDRLEQALCQGLPKWFFKRAWTVAIDWHSTPYHGEPQRYESELRHGKPQSGTTKFHVYATACVVQRGSRYTLAATWVRGTEDEVTVLERLLNRLKTREIRVKRLLLDRQFFKCPVIAYLQSIDIPFVMPVVLRGRRRKHGKEQGLRHFKTARPGRYLFHWTTKMKLPVTFHVVVSWKFYFYRKAQRRVAQRLLFGVWKVRGSPREIRELYRSRFAIETSYRQMGETRIRTCTRDPRLRLFYVLVELVLRNVWVWLHFRFFTEQHGRQLVLHLERLRFRQMLHWIQTEVVNELHDGSEFSVELLL